MGRRRYATARIPANQITLDQGFAALGAAGPACTPANVTSAPASCFAGVRLHATDPNYRPAVSNQWNLSMQRQISNAFTAQAAYVGQHTDHLAAIYNMGQNMLLPNGTAVPGPYLAGNLTLKNDGTGQQRLNTSTGVQNYQALQLLAQERLAKGLAFGINYTWSKCLTNNQGYYGRYGNSRRFADYGGCLLPVVRIQRQRAGLRSLRRGRNQRVQRLFELRAAFRP